MVIIEGRSAFLLTSFYNYAISSFFAITVSYFWPMAANLLVGHFLAQLKLVFDIFSFSLSLPSFAGTFLEDTIAATDLRQQAWPNANRRPANHHPRNRKAWKKFHAENGSHNWDGPRVGCRRYFTHTVLGPGKQLKTVTVFFGSGWPSKAWRSIFSYF